MPKPKNGPKKPTKKSLQPSTARPYAVISDAMPKTIDQKTLPRSLPRSYSRSGMMESIDQRMPSAKSVATNVIKRASNSKTMPDAKSLAKKELKKKSK